MGRFLGVWLALVAGAAALAAPVALPPPGGARLEQAVLGAMIASSMTAAVPPAGTAAADPAATPWMRALASGDAAGAERLLDAASRADPRDANLLYYLGVARNALGRYTDAIAALAKAKALAVDDPDTRLQLALALIALGRWAEARADLEWLWKVAPRTENLGFYLGHTYYLAGEPARAIPVLRANVSQEPRYAQLAQYYLALAEKQVGNVTAAREALSQASRLVPGSPLANQAEQNLNQIQVAARERRFQVDARAAVQYDDNVRFAPLTNVFGLRDQRLDSFGTLLFVRPQWIVARDRASELTLGYTGSFTHNVSIPELDLDTHAAAAVVTARRRWRERTITGGVSLTGEHTRLGGDPFASRFAITPFATIPFSPVSFTNAFLQLARREIETPFPLAQDDVRSSVTGVLGVNHFQLYRRGRHYLKLGVLADRDEAEGLNFRYDGVRPLAGAYVSTQDGLSLTLDAQRHERRYDRVNTTFGLKRKDTEDVVSLRLAKYWARAGTSLVLDGILTDTDSTIPLFKFRRNVTTLGLTYRY